MIEQECEKLRAVAWTELFPWLNIFRTFRMAIRVRSLLLGAVAIVLTVFGWALIDLPFSGSDLAEQQLAIKAGTPWASLTSLVPDQPSLPGKESINPIVDVWKQLSSQLVAVFSARTGFGGLIHHILCGLWAVLIWAWFGGAITRSAALELAAEERVGTGELFEFVRRRWRAYFAAPLFPLLGVLLATIVISLFGLLLNTGLSMWVSAILWPLLLVGGLMMAVLLLGLWFGWPLMWPTISSEGTDSFDALSRTYAYVFQKPLHYLWYLFVAGLFGVICWVLVWNFAAAVIALTDWAASWGCGYARMTDVADGTRSLGSGQGAALLIHIWQDCVRIIAVGFLYSYFWTASTAIYFLLRRNVDATEMDEIFVEDEQAEEVYGLPKVDTDEAGAPSVDTTAETQSTDSPEEE